MCFWIRIQELFTDSSSLQYGAFSHYLAHISGKTDRNFVKIKNFITDATLDKEDPVKFWESSRQEQICLDRGLRSPGALVKKMY